MSAVTRIRRSEELTVPFTRDEVWAALTDFAAYPDWWPAGLGVRILAPSHGLPSGQCEVRGLFGQPVRFHLEELEPPRHVRLRFFDGGLEGPGGFHLTPSNGATTVVYAVDVFARSLPVAALSFVLPIGAIHALRMRRVLRGLRGVLKRRRKSEAVAARLAAIKEEQAAATERRAAEEAGARAADEEASRLAALRAAEAAAEKRAAEETAARAAEEEASRLAAPREPEAAEGEEAALSPAPASGEGGHAGAADRGPFSGLRALAQRVARWLSDSPHSAAAAEVVGNGVPEDDRSTNVGIAHAYVQTLSAGAGADAVAGFFEANAEVEEFPSLVLPEGATRDRDGMLKAWSHSMNLWSGQRFDVVDAIAGGSQVAVEIRWTGTALERVGPFGIGESVEAKLCFFLKFHEQRIIRQRAHACYQAPPSDLSAFARTGTGEASLLSPTPGRGEVPALKKGTTHFEIARSYFEAMSAGVSGEAVVHFFAPDAIQEDYLHYFDRTGVSRDRRAIQHAWDSRLGELRSEEYQLMGAVGEGSKVALEVPWTGVVGSSHAHLEEGTRLQSRLAVFLHFEGGLILRQRTYESLPQVLRPISPRA